MDNEDPHLRTNIISSRVAPASSAARMWRRVPSALRLVQAAFKLTLTNSINFRGKTERVHGLVLILRQSSAHFGSHSRNLSKAESQGPVSCPCSTMAFLSEADLLMYSSPLFVAIVFSLLSAGYAPK